MSRVTGLVREMVMARLFGAGFVYDAFLLGFRIPNLTRDLFAEGALSAAFVPIFTQTLAQKGRKEAAVLSNLVATALILIVGVVCALGVIFSPALVDLLAEGFHQVPGKFELAVHMTRIMFPFLLLVALAAQAMGVLNACNRFAVPALASTFFNIRWCSASPWAIGLDRCSESNPSPEWLSASCWAERCNCFGKSPRCAKRDSAFTPRWIGIIPACAASSA
jgi:putative peptidoglycan lipid II flippase